jgi:hypothetical protein
MNSQYLHLFLLHGKFDLNSNLSLLMRRSITLTVSPPSDLNSEGCIPESDDGETVEATRLLLKTDKFEFKLS